jgi:predicted AlkP superfamily pyrophosphatase or phosphodiesterase
MEKLDSSFYDRNSTLVNFSSSLLKHFGVKPFHTTLPEADKALKDHKKVVVFLFDGSGKYNLNLYPHSAKFILSHGLTTIHSVNPATTVACTTAFLSGLYPIETGWLGWSLYFNKLNAPVDVFPNRYSLSGEVVEEPNLMNTMCPYKNIATLMQEKGVKADLYFEYPINGENGPKTLKEMGQKAGAFFKDGGQFLYCYWKNPDEFEHEYGVKNFHVRHVMSSLNKFMKKFTKENPDVLAFTMADHGLIDVQYRDIAAFKDLTSTLAKPMSIEGRTPTFFIKDGQKEAFEASFKKHFENDGFYLMSREDVLKNGYFGEGKANEHALEFIGDYVAVSLKNQILVDSSLDKHITIHKGHHAGGTKEEREVLLGVYNA